MESVIESLTTRFKDLETHKILQAAAKLVDPREWPRDEAELASYGVEHILDVVGCGRRQARYQEWPNAKVLIKQLPQAQQSTAWTDFMADPDRQETFPNLLMVVELVLVLPMSTAACERGFSAMKRIKTDWRSSLSVEMLWKLIYVSIEGPEVAQFQPDRVVQRWLSAGERARHV